MRLRLRFSKTGKVRWTSHRDVARMWERAFRRVRLPIAHTEGFSPRPKLSFGLALPTGAESCAEYLDVHLDHRGGEVGPEELVPSLSSALPPGVDAVAVRLEEEGASLQEDVTSCRWELEVEATAAADLAARVERTLAAPSIRVKRQRKGREIEDDLRPAILSLTASGPDRKRPARLDAVLATQPRGVRPSELLEGIGSEIVLTRMTRTHQWIERDGARLEPIPLDATDAQHALERAS